MSVRQREVSPPPLLRPRDFIRLASLLVAAGFILWAMMRASDPRTWQWVTVFQKRPAVARLPEEPLGREPLPITDTERLALLSAADRASGALAVFTAPTTTPAAIDLGLLGVLAHEFVPLPGSEMPIDPEAGKHAPVPLQHWLTGARDRDVFLVEDENAPEQAPERRDADARYHLLSLAKEATLPQLATDAQKGVRFTALLEKPREHRGQIIEIRGDLQWIKTFELQRATPGMDFVYEGVIEVPGTGHSYWVLFTDLPPGLPPERQWTRLFLRDVTFRGYFLKVLKVVIPADDKRPARATYLPVLVGKSPELPPQPEKFSVWETLKLVAIIGGILFGLVIIVLYLYRRSERRYEAKMAEVRARARQQPTGGFVDPLSPEGTSPAGPPVPGSGDETFQHRNGDTSDHREP